VTTINLKCFTLEHICDHGKDLRIQYALLSFSQKSFITHELCNKLVFHAGSIPHSGRHGLHVSYKQLGVDTGKRRPRGL